MRAIAVRRGPDSVGVRYCGFNGDMLKLLVFHRGQVEADSVGMSDYMLEKSLEAIAADVDPVNRLLYADLADEIGHERARRWAKEAEAEVQIKRYEPLIVPLPGEKQMAATA
jgi:hypothetical protein